MYNPETAKQNILLTLKTGYISVDMEGGDLVDDTTVEISAIRYSPDGERIDSCNIKSPMTRLISKRMAEKMDMASEMIKSESAFKQDITKLIDLIGRLPLIGHSISSRDLPMLNYYSLVVYNRKLHNPVIDTCRLEEPSVQTQWILACRRLLKALG